MEIRYDKASVKFLKELPLKWRTLIMEAIKWLTQKPPKGDIKTLQGYKDGKQRLRVGKYHVIYRYTMDGEIEILVVIGQVANACKQALRIADIRLVFLVLFILEGHNFAPFLSGFIIPYLSALACLKIQNWAINAVFLL